MAEPEKFSIQKFVPEVLRDNPNQRMTAREISISIFQRHRDSCLDKQRRSSASKNPLLTEKDLIQQIVAEIGAQRDVLETRHSIRTTETRPRRYYFSSSTDEQEIYEDAIPAAPKEGAAQTVSESDLYPLLSQFLFSELSIMSMRIDEKRASNRNGPRGNHWLYPDVVGIEDLSQDWHREVSDCASAYMDKKSKLYSFEVKLVINRSNVRECFFQAVSNSSWANFGYLVAGAINGAGTLSELRMLCAAHGIGVIQLSAEDHEESTILIPSRERPDVDWQSVNRIASENSDFLEFVKRVRKFYQANDINPRDWDHTSGR